MIRSRTQGFTLLEVMVAVAILALALTSIFSSEVGAIKVARRSQTMSIATLLARCKMGEIEELVANEGLPAVSKEDRDECCEGAEQKGFSCEWKIERVVIPEPPVGDDGLLPEKEEEQGAEDPTDLAGGSFQDMAAGAMGDGAMGDLALSYAFPILKPAIEEQVRRATVRVMWKEGERELGFDVVQFLVNDQGSATPQNDEDVDGDDNGGEGP
ncbi:MAG: prepilin-type N-terminal cleavage/methylation domain-containing protein [Myxococcales bacterium]|nr:prepilin-type N-terminal cleavage/methylation domain-containing protein [Myxococcales bacterium]